MVPLQIWFRAVLIAPEITAPYLAPGEVATIGVIAAGRKQARSIFRFIIGLLRAVRPLAAMVEDETEVTTRLTNRVSIVMFMQSEQHSTPDMQQAREGYQVRWGNANNWGALV